MQCRDAQFYLRMRRHAADELGPDVTAPLGEHLAACPACAADARAVQSFDRALAGAMVAVPVPSGLRDRLVTHAATLQGTALRRKVYKVGALVTAAMLLIGIGFGVFTKTRPKADAYELVESTDEQLSDPERSTEKWLAAQKLPKTLPLPFDYNLLVFCGYEKVHDRKVPVVVFRSGREFAKVYLFAQDGRFDLKGLQDAQASLTSAKVVVGQESHRNVTYVFVHTGGPNGGLEQFFVNRNNGRFG